MSILNLSVYFSLNMNQLFCYRVNKSYYAVVTECLNFTSCIETSNTCELVSNVPNRMIFSMSKEYPMKHLSLQLQECSLLGEIDSAVLL